MNCRQAQDEIAAYLDNERPDGLTAEVRAHLDTCPTCAHQLQQQQAFRASIAAADPAANATAPDALWEAIESNLDAPSRPEHARTSRLIRLLHRPMAIAASLAIFASAAIFAGFLLSSGAEQAHAGTIDYSVLLDGLSGRVDAAIDKFLAYYDAEPIPAEQAASAAPRLSFALPPQLPGGFTLRQAYRLKFGDSPGVAAIYDRGDEPLVVFFHPILQDVRAGKYRETPCIVGERHGHQVEVGDWRLMHFMDKTTCHCVLTKLPPNGRDLPEIVHRIAPDYVPDAAHHH